jgi:hypothetical protein
MLEFAAVYDLDTYAYGLNTVIMAGPTVLLALFALGAAWMNRAPSRPRAFEQAPALGV